PAHDARIGGGGAPPLEPRQRGKSVLRGALRSAGPDRQVHDLRRSDLRHGRRRSHCRYSCREGDSGEAHRDPEGHRAEGGSGRAPLALGVAPRAVSEAAPAARVLVVDDEEGLRVLVASLLRDRGYEVQEAADGEEALRRLEAEAPELLVLDLVMPRLDGWGVLAQLATRAERPPVVVLTADYDGFARAVREGAAGYVFKPFKSDELTAICD